MLYKIAESVLNEKFLYTCSTKIENFILKIWHKLLNYIDVLISFIPKKIVRSRLEINPRRIVFMTNSFNYTCNPKYICEKLLESDNDYDIVWLTNNVKRQQDSYPSNVRLIKYNTLRAFKYVYSAKIWLGNITGTA